MTQQVTIELPDKAAAALEAMAARDGMNLQELMFAMADDIVRRHDALLEAIAEGRRSVVEEGVVSLDEVERDLLARMPPMSAA